MGSFITATRSSGPITITGAGNAATSDESVSAVMSDLCHFCVLMDKSTALAAVKMNNFANQCVQIRAVRYVVSNSSGECGGAR